MKKFALVLCLASAPAMACNQGDLTGRWSLFVQDFSCLMTVQADGKVSAGQCIQMPEDPDRSNTRASVRGRLKVQSDCRVTGRLNTKDRELRDVRMNFGQTRLGPSAESWIGQAYVGRTSSPAFNIGDDMIVSGEYSRFDAVYVN